MVHLLKVANEENLINFRALLLDNVSLRLSDEHLWMSVIMRPKKSTFSRLQRLTCLFTLLSLTMITNAMFFGKEGTQERSMGVNIGPIKFTATQLYISAISIVIATPLSLLLIELFRRSKPTLSEVSSVQLTKHAEHEHGAQNIRENHTRRLLTSYSTDPSHKLLPHWVVYIAWTLALLAFTTSIFFLVMYSLDWGREKSNEWTNAFFLSLIQDFFFVDPLKVFSFYINQNYTSGNLVQNFSHVRNICSCEVIF